MKFSGQKIDIGQLISFLFFLITLTSGILRQHRICGFNSLICAANAFCSIRSHGFIRRLLGFLVNQSLTGFFTGLSRTAACDDLLILLTGSYILEDGIFLIDVSAAECQYAFADRLVGIVFQIQRHGCGVSRDCPVIIGNHVNIHISAVPLPVLCIACRGPYTAVAVCIACRRKCIRNMHPEAVYG